MKTHSIEQWQPVKDYEFSYHVSNQGRVKSLERTIIIGNYPTEKRMPEVIVKLRTHYRGYRFIHLHKAGVRQKFFVHRLVAQAFLDNPDSLPLVNHKDRDKSNNDLSNLEWISYSGNTQHYHDTERMKAAENGLDTTPVAEVDLPW